MHLFKSTLIVLSAVFIVGCASKAEVWNKVQSSEVDYAVIKPGTSFSQYSHLKAEPFEIFYPSKGEKPDPQDLARIRKIFRDAFFDAVGGKYLVVSRKGPNVLAVRASLVDLRNSTPNEPLRLGKLTDVAHPGRMTLLMEFIDSESGEVLAHAADEEKLETTTEYVGPEADWDAVKTAAERWAGMFRTFLDNNLNQ